MTEREMSNVEHVKLWIEALESGEFDQGKSQLRDGSHYCCLGVAVVVAERAGVTVGGFDWGDNATWGGLPEIETFYGLQETVAGCHQPSLPIAPPYSRFDRRAWCSEANDDLGLSFVEIAVLLREDYGLEKQASA